jgi:hypothetical protein
MRGTLPLNGSQPCPPGRPTCTPSTDAAIVAVAAAACAADNSACRSRNHRLRPRILVVGHSDFNFGEVKRIRYLPFSNKYPKHWFSESRRGFEQ